jgi:hypothetical protein
MFINENEKFNFNFPIMIAYFFPTINKISGDSINKISIRDNPSLEVSIRVKGCLKSLFYSPL